MKKVFLLAAFFSIALSAQTKDTVDIRAMIQQQINAARERDRLAQVKKDSLEHPVVYFGPELPKPEEKLVYFGPEPEYFGPVEAPVVADNRAAADSIAKAEIARKNAAAAQKIISAPIAPQKAVSDGSSWKFYFLGTVAMAAFLFVFIRRALLSRTGKKDKSLKNNIRILREEHLVAKQDTSLKQIRSKLLNSPVILNNHGKPLAEVAKELNISQEEILLAARIKSYELAKGKKDKWFLN